MALTDVIITALLTLSSALLSGFGNSLEPVSILAWIQPAVALAAYDRLVLLKPAWGERRPRLWHLTGAAILTAANALGGTIAFAGVLSFPSTTVTSLAAAFGFAVAISSLTTAVALLGTHLACNKWPGTIVAVLVYPCLSTCTHTLTAFAISSFVSPGNAVMDYEPLRQMCAVWGVAGAVALISATAAVAYLHLTAASPAFLGRDSVSFPPAVARRPYEQLPSTDDVTKLGSNMATVKAESVARQGSVTGAGTGNMAYGTPAGVPPALYRVTGLLLMAWCLVAALGGLLAQAGMFYQVNVETMLPRTIQASCLIESSENPGTPGWARLWERTESRFALGDDLVLWAEECVNVTFPDGEEQLLRQARQLINKHGNRSYLGLSYQAWHPDRQLYTNHFTLLQQDGSVAWNYKKAYPVPVVEAEVIPGDATLPIHDSPFGRLSGAICFDLDHAHFAMTAAQQGVDIMLQPSWTWGAVGPRHFSGNQLRALEGGFTIIRCSSSGVSGVVTPGGQVTTQALTGPSDQVIYTVPLFPRRWTPYVHMGLHYVELLNLGLAVLVWGMILAPSQSMSWVASLVQRMTANHASNHAHPSWQPAAADSEEQPLSAASGWEEGGTGRPAALHITPASQQMHYSSHAPGRHKEAL